MHPLPNSSWGPIFVVKIPQARGYGVKTCKELLNPIQKNLPRNTPKYVYEFF